ncbi:LytR family transcriptional regulator [Aeromicrobium phragmitis]|uniref:LytR family transcriptional regulator n=1 Tax=Aeromicrobium phragmitis TaxID=2478914 RepID=A0A3L8PIN6_9ACTN|nr:LytR C-terminal domain-containing protein [Aeromicrobium phragmitis]RLV55040.1 LytR family transcriptional regulator [Aeromicrobium phragmitis]
MTVEGPPAPSHRRESGRRTAILAGLTALAVLTGVLVALALQRGDAGTPSVQPPTLATPTPSEESEPAPPSEPEPESETEPEPEPEPEPESETEPETETQPETAPVARTLGVMVLNATRITGLAAQTSGTVSNAGWTVVGSGNARGSYPGDTIYYPAGGYEQAQLLAADLGIGRLMPNLADMPSNRLTVVLTSAR